MKIAYKPGQFRACLILMVATLACNVLYLYAFDIQLLAPYLEQSRFVYHTLQYLFIGFLIYMISRGKVWARLLWSVLYGIYFINIISTFRFDYEQYPAILSFIVIVKVYGEIVAIMLLWNPEVNGWFRMVNKVIPRESGYSAAAAPEDIQNRNLFSGISVREVHSRSPGEKKPYEILLKSLRFIRFLYIMVAANIVMSVIYYYGHIVTETAASFIPYDSAAMLIVDRIIVFHLLVIMFISAAYLIADSIIVTKIRTYPQELVDRGCSTSASLLMSVLYIYVFFYMGHSIVYYFNYMDPYVYEQNPVFINILQMVLMYLVIVYLVYKYMLQKVVNKKTWRNYWIASVCMFPVVWFLVIISDELIVKYNINIIRCLDGLLKYWGTLDGIIWQ